MDLKTGDALVMNTERTRMRTLGAGQRQGSWKCSTRYVRVAVLGSADEHNVSVWSDVDILRVLHDRYGKPRMKLSCDGIPVMLKVASRTESASQGSLVPRGDVNEEGTLRSVDITHGS